MTLNGIRVAMFVFNSLDRDPRVWKEAKALVDAGAAVDVYMLIRPGQEPVATQSGFSVIRFSDRSPKSRRPANFIPAYARLRQAVRGTRYDVVHGHDASTLPAAYAVARARGAPLIYDAHEYFPDHRPPTPGASVLRRWLERHSVNRLSEALFIRRARRVITVSDSFADMLQGHYRLPLRPLVLRNAAPYWEPPVEPEEDLRKLATIPSDRAVLMFHGGLSPHRGLERCVELMTRLRNCHLVLLGPGDPSYTQGLEGLATHLGVSDRVSILPPVSYDRLLPLVATADVGLYLLDVEVPTTSYRYSLPNKVFEYVMTRVPIVVPDLPEISRVVRRHDLGRPVDTRDLDLVAAAVGELMAPEENRRVRANLDRAARVLSWEAEQDDLLGLYYHVLLSPNGRDAAQDI